MSAMLALQLLGIGPIPKLPVSPTPTAYILFLFTPVLFVCSVLVVVVTLSVDSWRLSLCWTAVSLFIYLLNCFRGFSGLCINGPLKSIWSEEDHAVWSFFQEEIIPLQISAPKKKCVQCAKGNILSYMNIVYYERFKKSMKYAV